MSKFRALVSAAAASLTMAAGSAFAALPSGVGTGITSIETDGLAMVDLIWPVIISLVGAVVIMKLFKRFVNKV